MKHYAIIVAGGTGTRMKSAIPKQFLLLNERPVLIHTIETFLHALPGAGLILVLPEAHIETGKSILDTYFPSTDIQVVSGGETRFHSVKNGLRMVDGECIVFVHDAVRCMVSADLIRQCLDAALVFGSAIPVIDINDSVRIIEGEHSRPIDRSTVKLVQTPQVFQSGILSDSFKTDYTPSFTDEASVVEAAGFTVHLVPGEVSNIKITTPEDLETAERNLLKK